MTTDDVEQPREIRIMMMRYAWLATLCVAGIAMAQDPFATSFAPCVTKAEDLDRYVQAGKSELAKDNVADAVACSRRFLNWALPYSAGHPNLVEALKRRHDAYSIFVQALVPEFSEAGNYRTQLAELRSSLQAANERVVTEGREAKLIQ